MDHDFYLLSEEVKLLRLRMETDALSIYSEFRQTAKILDRLFLLLALDTALTILPLIILLFK